MQPLQTIATRVLADTIRRQPPSPARTAFAWGIAVGPALARSTSVELHGVTLVVHPRDARWTDELERAKDTILSRLRVLLGPDAVARLSILEQ